MSLNANSDSDDGYPVELVRGSDSLSVGDDDDADDADADSSGQDQVMAPTPPWRVQRAPSQEQRVPNERFPSQDDDSAGGSLDSYRRRTDNPTSVEAIRISDEFRTTVSGEQFFQKDIDIGDDKILLFATVANLRSLGASNSWITDGKFITDAASCLMVPFVIFGCSPLRPLVYALMTRKTLECFRQLLHEVRLLAADHNVTLWPRYIMTDFRMAEIASFGAEFAGAIAKGCPFDFSQSIYRKLQQYGQLPRYETNRRFAELIRQLFALAFLPHTDIEQAFHDIKPKYRGQADRLIEWFERTFVVGQQWRHGRRQRCDPIYPPRFWSVHDESAFDKNPPSKSVVETLRRPAQQLGVYSIVELFRDMEENLRTGRQPDAAAAAAQNPVVVERNRTIRRIVAERARHRPAGQFLKKLAKKLCF